MTQWYNISEHGIYQMISHQSTYKHKLAVMYWIQWIWIGLKLNFESVDEAPVSATPPIDWSGSECVSVRAGHLAGASHLHCEIDFLCLSRHQTRKSTNLLIPPDNTAEPHHHNLVICVPVCGTETSEFECLLCSYTEVWRHHVIVSVIYLGCNSCTRGVKLLVTATEQTRIINTEVEPEIDPEPQNRIISY